MTVTYMVRDIWMWYQPCLDGRLWRVLAECSVHWAEHSVQFGEYIFECAQCTVQCVVPIMHLQFLACRVGSTVLSVPCGVCSVKHAM